MTTRRVNRMVHLLANEPTTAKGIKQADDLFNTLTDREDQALRRELELREYRYVHDGETVISLDPLPKYQVREIVRNRKSLARATRRPRA